MYGVSEIPVREACKRLEAEKLVVIGPYEGVTVSELDLEEVEETILVRAILEREAARTTVPHISKELQSSIRSLGGPTSNFTWHFSMPARIGSWPALPEKYGILWGGHGTALSGCQIHYLGINREICAMV